MLFASIANERKAIETTVLNVGRLSSVSDYIIICSGSSDRQVRAIADNVVRKMKRLFVKPFNMEGYSEGKWILIDYNDIIIHVFYEPVRAYYRLEELWPEAEQVSIPKGYLDKFEMIKEP